MSVTIKYKGNTIASANTDTTKTLKTSGKYCEGDIVVENVQDGGITPSGTLPITENGTYDVTEYASADVNVSGGTEITDGIVVKARDANGFPTEVDIYGTVNNYMLTNDTNYGHTGSGFSKVEKVNLKSNQSVLGTGAFFYLPNLKEITGVENVTTIGTAGNTYGIFANTAITDVVFPKLTAVLSSFFAGCTSLKTANFPSATNISGGSRAPFNNCTALTSVQLGSIGHAVTNVDNQAFNGCTQAGLTITVFCTAAYSNTALANIRAKATNATIIIKDSTTGDVIVTSTP